MKQQRRKQKETKKNWSDCLESLLSWLKLIQLGLILLFLLLLLSSCAGSSKTTAVPLVLLQEQKIVCKSDTNGDLMECFIKCVNALDSCNQDKLDILHSL